MSDEICTHGMVWAWCATPVSGDKLCQDTAPGASPVKPVSNKAKAVRNLRPESTLLTPIRPITSPILDYWHPSAGEEVTVVDPRADTVHLIGYVTFSDVNKLLIRCKKLRVIEGTPSQRKFLSCHLELFAERGIGITLVRRRPHDRSKTSA